MVKIRAYITVGMGFGDEGKGSIVDFLTGELPRTTVIRYSGGHQCGHRVVRNNKEHIFSQFGSGSLNDVPTYIDSNVIVNPNSYVNERRSLVTKGTEYHPTVVFHPQCLVSTVFHKVHNQTRELLRSSPESKHGTCGQGIGSTREYWLMYGSDSIFAGDLKDRNIVYSKMELIRQRFMYDYPHEKENFQAIDFVSETEKLIENGSFIRVEDLSDAPFMFNFNRAKHDDEINLVFEGAQGILLDENFGFHPNYTWSTVTPLHAIEFLQKLKSELDYKITSNDIEYTVIGITRSYMTRHGAGYFPSAQKISVEEDPSNPVNQWQGSMRSGLLDIDLLEYSKTVCSRIGIRIDSVAVNCLDQIESGEYFYDNYTFNDTKEKMQNKNMVRLPKKTSSICKEIERVIAPISIKGYGESAQKKQLDNIFKWHKLS